MRAAAGRPAVTPRPDRTRKPGGSRYAAAIAAARATRAQSRLVSAPISFMFCSRRKRSSGTKAPPGAALPNHGADWTAAAGTSTSEASFLSLADLARVSRNGQCRLATHRRTCRVDPRRRPIRRRRGSTRPLRRGSPHFRRLLQAAPRRVLVSG